MFEQIETEHEYEMRAVIFEAASDLLRAYSYRELTVKDICRIAGISKPTFYRYFADKYAIAEWATSHYMRKPYQAMMYSSTCKEMLCALTDHALRYKDFYRKAYILPEAGTLLDLRVRSVIDGFEEVLYRRHRVPRDEALDFQIEFAANAILTMLSHWLAQDMPYPPETLAGYLEAIIPRRLRELFDSLVSA